jgi:2-iminobutanoate/2-iminopropanoate deaminase
MRDGEGTMQKSFVRGTWQQKRAYSPCVITQGAGRTIYIAGHTGHTDDSGKSLAGDFDAQFHQIFRNISAGPSIRLSTNLTPVDGIA